MDLATIIGFLRAFGIVAVGILMGMFVNVPSLFIVLPEVLMYAYWFKGMSPGDEK